jgi:oxygen-independent coproporphyrinogen III oxidase
MISLYIHIPFCKKKCNYCDFSSFAGKEDLMPSYIESIKKESSFTSASYNHPKVSTIFIGGGTPTLLSDELMSSLFETIKNDFDVDEKAEISVEANPGTINGAKMINLASLGVNRVSLGAQSFNDKLLKKLGRIHQAYEIVSAVEAVRAAGINNINLDLIFGLPDETLKDWENTLNKAIDLEPQHIAAYNLTIEEGTPFFTEKNKGSLHLPNEDMELDMFKLAIDKLAKNGYAHYEISNFAKPGFECEHNKTYWTMKNYIGLGAGAHSFINGERIENLPSIDDYIKNEPSAIKKSHKNTKKETMQEMIFLGLRLMEGFNLNDFTNRFGIGFRELYKQEIQDLTGDKMIEFKGKNVVLTQKGLYLANEVFRKFL